MSDHDATTCAPVSISDEDVYAAMKQISGYLDITADDFKELYLHAYQQAVIRLTSSAQAKHVMTKDVCAVSADTPLSGVARIMAARDVSGVPVIDEKKKVLGVISEIDFLKAMGSGGSRNFMAVVTECLKGGPCVAMSAKAQLARDLMSKPAVTVSEDTTALEISELFLNKKINRVPVVNAKGALVGIVSRGDILHAGVPGETA